MTDILVVVGSVTGATRLAKKLNKYGDSNARVINTPASLGGSGCSYSVSAALSSENFIRSMAHGITFKKIYLEETIGGEKYYHDISR